MAGARTLVIEKEKCLILAVIEMRNDYRTADRSAELVLPEFSFGNSSGILEEICGVELVIAKEFPERPVEMVGAGLNGGIQNGSGGPSELGAKAIGLNLEFLDGVDRRADHKMRAVEEVDELNVIVNAVKQVVVLCGPQAIRGKASAASEPTRVLLTLSDAGRELSKKDVVASIQWKSVYRAFTDDLSDGGVLCLEHRRRCVHDYGLHRLARRQREIDHYSLLHIDRNVLLLDLLEALHFCGYRVTSNLDRRKNIFASGAASGRHGESRIFIGNGHFDAGNDPAAGVFDGARNCSRIDLCEGRYSKHQPERDEPKDFG